MIQVPAAVGCLPYEEPRFSMVGAVESGPGVISEARPLRAEVVVGQKLCGRRFQGPQCTLVPTWLYVGVRQIMGMDCCEDGVPLGRDGDLV